MGPESFERQMADDRTDPDGAVADLDRHVDEPERAAARRLGSLFNPGGLPRDAPGFFGVLNERVCG